MPDVAMHTAGDGDRWATKVHELANATLKIAHRRNAANLVEQILDVGATLKQEAAVAVIGRRSVGKSNLLSALVGAAVTPSQMDVATSTYIQIDYGGTETANGPRCFAFFRDPERSAEEIPAERVGEYAMVGGAHTPDVSHIEVLADAPVLRDGIRLVDTPGLGGLHEAHEQVTLQVLGDVDALLLVLDAGQPITDDEREVLRRASEQVGRALIAANKAEGDHAAVLAFNANEIAELPGWEAPRIVPVSARLGIEAARLAHIDGRAAAAVRAKSGMDELEDRLRELLAAVVRDRYRRLLERTSAVLEELARPDREQLAIVEQGGDGAERAEQLTAELERLNQVHPVTEINVRMGRIRQDVTDAYRGQVPPTFREIKDRVAGAWTPAMVDTLPVTCEMRARVLWGDAVAALREQSRTVVEQLDAELALGDEPGGALLELARGEDDELPTTYQPGDDVPEPLEQQTPAEQGMRRAMRIMMAAGAGNLAAVALAVPGLNLVLLPLAIPAGLYLSHKEDQAMRTRATRQAALTYVAESQSAALALQSPLAARATRIAEDLARQYQQRWLGRRETLTRTIRQVKAAGSDQRAASERLAAVTLLLQTRDALLVDPACPPSGDVRAPAR